MFIKSFEDCEKWIEKPLSEPESVAILTDLIHPQKDKLPIGYNLAHFELQPDCRTIRFRLLKANDVIVILTGSARVEVGNESVDLEAKHVLFIPAGAARCIFNTGATVLEFLSIAEPEFKPEESEILEQANIQIKSN